MLYSQATEKGESSLERNSKLSDAYGRWFEVIPANTAELR
jgi:hypothetical protein